MRIVAGRFKGAKIATPAPDDRSIRPSSDRLRESLFNILSHRHEGDAVRDARVLDLFSGTGALGLEALSRGAKYCLFVEEATGARALIRRNVEALNLTGCTKIFRRDATSLGPIGTMAPFNLVFADPPYGKGLGEAALAAAADGGWLAPGALCILEERSSAEITLPAGFEELDRRAYGEGQIVVLQWQGLETQT